MALTEKQRKEIQKYQGRNVDKITFIKHIKNTHFNVGDILIKRYFEYDYDSTDRKWKSTVAKYHGTDVPERFKVLYVEDDIPYVQALNLQGRLTDEVVVGLNATSFYEDESYEIYEVDPIMVEHTILGQRYNVAALLKEAAQEKAQNVKHNKALATHCNSIKDTNAFFSKLKDGDIFYMQYANPSHDEAYLNPVTAIQVQNVQKVMLKDIRGNRKHPHCHTIKSYDTNWPELLNDDHIYMFSQRIVNHHNQAYDPNATSMNYSNCVIYAIEPKAPREHY